MIKKLICKYELDEDYGGEAHSAESLLDGDKKIYSISNFTWRPEDAILARDLPDVEKAVDLIRYGMDLAASGYSDVTVDYVEGIW